MATPVRVLSNREVPVTITPNPKDPKGQPTVSPGTFHVSKCRMEEVWWVCSDPNAKFTVTFEGESPFNDSVFDNENYCSGLVKREVEPSKDGESYKYSVTVNDGEPLDPDGQVDR